MPEEKKMKLSIINGVFKIIIITKYSEAFSALMPIEIYTAARMLKPWRNNVNIKRERKLRSEIVKLLAENTNIDDVIIKMTAVGSILCKYRKYKCFCAVVARI